MLAIRVLAATSNQLARLARRELQSAVFNLGEAYATAVRTGAALEPLPQLPRFLTQAAATLNDSLTLRTL